MRKMQGTINHFRRSKKKTYSTQMIIIVDGVTKKEDAKKLVGKKITYNTGKKDIVGKVSAAHGNIGAIRATFSTGMPGQAIGKKVKIE
jgi:ribosomal protein L35AE/L33A